MNEDSSNLIPQELEVIHNNVDQNGAPILINPYILKLTERLTTITIDIINNAVQQSLDAATKSIKDAQEKFVKSIRDACYCGDNQPWKFEAALFTIKNNRSKKNGLSIDCCDRNGINALQFACARGHLQLVKVLMQHGANIDAKTQTPRSWSCLHFACFYRKPDIIHLLIERGCILQRCGNEGPFPNLDPLEMTEKLKKIKDGDRMIMIELLETAEVEVREKEKRKSIL